MGSSDGSWGVGSRRGIGESLSPVGSSVLCYWELLRCWWTQCKSHQTRQKSFVVLPFHGHSSECSLKEMEKLRNWRQEVNEERRGRPHKSWLTGANSVRNLSHLAGSAGTSLSHLWIPLHLGFLLCSLRGLFLSSFPLNLSTSRQFPWRPRWKQLEKIFQTSESLSLGEDEWTGNHRFQREIPRHFALAMLWSVGEKNLQVAFLCYEVFYFTWSLAHNDQVK